MFQTLYIIGIAAQLDQFNESLTSLQNYVRMHFDSKFVTYLQCGSEVLALTFLYLHRLDTWPVFKFTFRS